MTPIQKNPKVAARLGQLEAQKMKTTLLAVEAHMELLAAWGNAKDEVLSLEAACDRIRHAIVLLEDEADYVLGKGMRCSWCLKPHEKGACDQAAM